jgi:hypothetical protein
MLAVVLALALQDVADAVNRLSSDDIAERDQAELDLALLGDPAARELEKLRESGDADLAGRAARALTMNRRRRGLPESLCRREPRVLERDWSLAELLALKLTPDEEGFLGPRAARDWTLPAHVWLRVARGHGRACDYAEAAKRAPDEALRAAALTALADVEPASAVRLAAEWLRSPSIARRAAAARTLGDVGPASSAADLQRLTNDPVPGVAESAKVALRRLEERSKK